MREINAFLLFLYCLGLIGAFTWGIFDVTTDNWKHEEKCQRHAYGKVVFPSYYVACWLGKDRSE